MKALLLTSCLTLTLASGTASAGLISMNDAFFGAGSITRDSVTGFDWLDLTKSTNLSVNDILGGAGGFQAHGFQLATLAQVEAMFTSGGWDGVDDSASAGSPAHLAFAQSMQNLFGVTGDENGTDAFGSFNEGWALTPVANRTSRPFITIPGPLGTTGRVACTTAGFNTFTAPVNDFQSCRMDFDQRFDFIGAYLVRDPSAQAPVPEPATLFLLGSGLLAAGLRRRKTQA